MNQKLFIFLTIVYTLRMYLPISMLIPSPFLIAIIILLLTVYIPAFDKVRNGSYWSLCFVLFVFQVLMRLDIGDSIIGTIYAFLILVPSGLVTFYLFKNEDDKLLNFVFYSIIISIGITGFTTYLGCLQFPGISREMATGRIEMYDKSLLTYRNIGGFDTIYIFTLMLPVWIAIVKDVLLSKKLRILAAIVLVTSIMGIVQSEYTTALIFMLLSFSLFFLPKEISINQFFAYMAIALLVILTFKQFLPSILSFIADNTSSSDVRIRMLALANAFSGQEIDTAETLSRIDKFKDSFEAFCSSPIWGTFEIHGGHSFVMVALGFGGLIGACLVIVMIKQLYNLFVLPLLNRGLNTCLYFICFMYLSYLILNPQPYLIAVLFLIPVSSLFIINQHEITIVR